MKLIIIVPENENIQAAEDRTRWNVARYMTRRSAYRFSEIHLIPIRGTINFVNTTRLNERRKRRWRWVIRSISKDLRSIRSIKSHVNHRFNLSYEKFIIHSRKSLKSSRFETGTFLSSRYEAFGQEREGHVERKRATIGRILLGSRTIIVTKQHQQVQSYGSRGTKTTVATGMSERESSWWRIAKVRNGFQESSTISSTTINDIRTTLLPSFRHVSSRGYIAIIFCRRPVFPLCILPLWSSIIVFSFGAERKRESAVRFTRF